MTFIYEPIPQADLDQIDFAAQVKKMPSFAHAPTIWAIDRERDVYLVCYATGGSQIDMPALYGLSYKGLGIVGLVLKEKYEPADPWCRIYDISRMSIDESIKPLMDVIHTLIEESLVCDGLNSQGVKSVKVRFPAQRDGE